MILTMIFYYTLSNEKYFSDGLFSYYSLCHYMRAWIRVLVRPVAMNTWRGWRESPHYKAQARPGLVRTVGLCAQRRVALMPRVIATAARDALSKDPRETAARFERPAKEYITKQLILYNVIRE